MSPDLVHVGCSGYVYAHWRGIFYPRGLPAREWLAWYAREFETVELNTTFYRLPPESAVRGWAALPVAGFHYAVKGSRYLTHMKRLTDTGRGIERFYKAIRPMLHRVGPILWQLPPQMKKDAGRLKGFLQALPRGRQRQVVEFRNPEWYSDEIYQVLEDHRASLCLHDNVDVEAPFPPPGPIYYRRFHGTQGRYGGRYGRVGVRRAAAEMATLSDLRKPCFAYFNNDREGHAIADARVLKQVLRELQGRAAGVEERL